MMGAGGIPCPVHFSTSELLMTRAPEAAWTRRALIAGGIGAGLLGSGLFGTGPRASASPRYPIADMHTHLFFIGPPTYRADIHPLGASMRAGDATLVVWALVGDLLWLKSTDEGLKQNGTPSAAAAGDFFKAELGRMRAHAASQGLKIALTPADLERARQGEPHVVLAVEGATFLDGNPDLLKLAYDEGVRHVQLVHYSQSALGDFQTGKPTHGGLTEAGHRVVATCNQLGILIGLAHASRATTIAALEASKSPIIWSHGSVAKGSPVSYLQPAWQARKLDLDTAKRIAAGGGVVGLWGLRRDIGGGPEAYADRLLELVDWLGDEHVGFGSDINSSRDPAIASFADLRRVVDILVHRGTDPARIARVSMGNYARLLGRVMDAT